MTYSILDAFDEKYGRWKQWSPWDTTQEFQSSKGFLSTQQHVDLRTFKPLGYRALSMSDLDALTMTQMDADTMSLLEEATLANDENWVKTGTGIGAITVGKATGYNGWSALTATTTGAALSATLISAMSVAIDISGGDKLSIIFPDYHTFDGTSYVQLSSDPAGAFGTGHDSAQVQFSSNGSVMPQLLLNVSSFANSGFDNTKVTGVKLSLGKAAAPAAGQTLTIMAIRSLKNAWVENALDFDTRSGHITVPVTLTGAAYAGTVGLIPLIRGDGSKLDPIPADGALSVYFSPGGDISRSSGVSYNYLELIFREIHDSVAVTGSWMTARLRFNGDGTLFSIFRTDWTNGGGETTAGAQNDTSINTLDPTKIYLFRVSYQGTSINAELWLTDGNRNPTTRVWKYAGYTSTAYPYRNGRVGLKATLVDRDAYIDYFDAAPRGYARGRSKIFTSRTPSDGARLAAVYANDSNLFDSFTATDLFVDHTKTLSGQGSYRSAATLISNAFVAEDWVNSYFNCSIWVPANATLKNQPQVVLVTPSGDQNISTPKLKPAQWNSLHFDLGIFRSLLTGVSYQIKFVPGTEPDKALGNYWVDNTVIGRRRVAWRYRAIANGTFRDFGDAVNDSKNALHLPPEERGTAIQLEWEALTDDAWVASYHLFPRYASLGHPVYDRGYETR